MKTKLLKLALCAVGLLTSVVSTSAQSWDFEHSAFTATELANIIADGTSIYSQNTANTRYTYVPVIDNASLKAQSTELDFTNGLKFVAKANGIRLFSKYALELLRQAINSDATTNANASYVIIPNVPIGATVTIKFKSNNANTVQIVSDELSDISTPEATTSDATYTGTVNAAGDVKIGYKITSGSAACQIRSISYAVNHNVTVLYNGEGAYGTASAAKSSVLEGQTTIITASPATGYKVTNWSVSGTGATIDPSGDSNSNTTTLTMGTADATVTCTFAIQTYTVNHTLTGATATSGATGDDAATYGTGYSAVFKANDGYVLPSAITVSIGGEEKTVVTDYTWNAATGTVTIPAAKVTGDIVITVTATKAAVVTKWNFEQYVPGVNMLGDKTGAPDYIEYLDGLYLHSRDADAANHLVATADVTIGTIAGENITSHVKTYKKDCSYTAVVIKSGDNSQAAKSATSPADNKSYSGFAFKAPANGILYYTYYVNATNAHIYEYKNGGNQKDNNVSYDSNNYTGKGGELSVSLDANDYVCITTTAANLYILDLSFVPTTADEVTKTVNISNAGYATFSATQNYDLPDGLEAYIVSSVNETKATLTQVNEIPACTGVILKGAEGPYTLTSKETTSVDVSSNNLKANIADYILPANDGKGNYNYTLAPGPKFMHSSGSGTLAAGKAFLRTTVNAGGGDARGFDLVFDEGETTGISEIDKLRNVGNEKFFDLQGRLVAQPTRGLYIVNGKKVIIK